MKNKLFFITWLLLIFNNVLTIEPEVIQKIGKQVWHNEASGREDLLVFWNKDESFPSLGIGHNIWFPTGHEIKYTQGFPALCAYLKQHNVKLPKWLEEAVEKGAPWSDREDFYNDKARLQELRKLLVDTIALQTQFMIDRLINKLPEIIHAAPIKQRAKIAGLINLMLASPLGIYVLVDYSNFKGDGLNLREKSNGQGWGLLSVLLEMPEDLNVENVTKAFALTAAKKLLMLIEHSAPSYSRLNFFPGWMNRLSTYANKIF